MASRLILILIVSVIGKQYLISQFAHFCPAQQTNGYVVELETYQNQVFATGLFTRICGIQATSIARWDGNQWKALTNTSGSSIDGGHALAIIQDSLYLAKYEWAADSNWVIRVDSSFALRKLLPGFWRSNPNPASNQVPILYDIVDFRGQMVVCGEFDRAGNRIIQGIAGRTDNGWEPLGGGLSGYIPNTYNLVAPHSMLVWKDDLYVAGNFLKAGDTVVNGVARWDGQRWHSVGQGFNAAALGFAVYQDELYACGEFTASGQTELGGVARWDGQQWVNPGFQLGPQIPGALWYVHTMREIDNKLFILGGFKNAIIDGDTLTCNGVVVFDGRTLDVLNGGLPSGDAEAILPYKNEIWIGGGIINGNAGHIHVLERPGSFHHPEEKTPVLIFPNPVNDEITLNAKGLRTFQFTWFDAFGKVHLTGTAQGEIHTWKTHHWHPGLYFLCIQPDGMPPFWQTVIKE
jgi:hypothetical protein